MNFRAFLFSSACALALCATHARAADEPVVEFDSVAAFRTWAGSATDPEVAALASFHLASYYCLSEGPAGVPCPNDGAEGLFVQKSDSETENCAVSLDDGGSVLVVNKGESKYCFYRANLNGDIRQFGVTKDSTYDCSPADGGVGGCESITANGTAAGDDRFDQMLAAATAAGLHNLTFAGLQLWTNHGIELPSGISLDLGGVSPPGQHRPNLLNFPGTLFLGQGKTLKMDDHTALRNGMILPDWYVPPTSTDTIATMYAQRQTMVTNGDTGVLCIGPSCIVENMEIDGFDTAFEADHPTATVVNNVAADGNVCFYFHGAGQSTIQNTKCFPNISVAFEGEGEEEHRLANQEFFRVTDVDEAPTGKMCRVTIASITGGPPVTDVQNDFIVWGTGADSDTGGVNIDSRFHALTTGTSGVFDLDGSYCDLDTGDNSLEGPTVVAAHWKEGDNRLYIDTASPPMDKILTREVITGLGTAGIPEGDEITGVWRNKKIVILGTPADKDGSGAVTFRSKAYTEPTQHCDGTNKGVCLVLDASARVEAGASAGGGDAGGFATGYMIGGPSKTGDEVAGLNAINTGVYSHAVEYHIQNSNEIHMLSPQNDSATYNDPSTIYAWVNGDSNQVAFIGGKGSKAGTAVLSDLDADDECLNFVAQNAQPSESTYNQFEVDGGCFIAQGIRPGTGNAFIADDASHVDLSESYLPKTSIWYQSEVAQGKTSTLTTTVSSGQNNLINQSYDATTGDQNPAPQPSADTLLQIVQSDGAKNRVLQDSVGATTVISGRRADGTASSRTAVQDDEQLAEFGGIGFDGSAYSTDNAAGVGVEACENWATGANCAATTLKATEKGTPTVAEVARAESGGFGIGTGEGVSVPLEVVNAGTTTHASNIHALLSSGTGSITVTNSDGFPTPGILLVDSELMAYTKPHTDNTHLNITARGVWGTTGQAHSNNSGSTLSFLNVLVGNSSTAFPQFAVTSRGGVWHLTTSGGAPAIDTTGGGGAGAGSPTIVGNDNAGRITLGTPASAVLKLNFATPWSNAPVCFAQDESATARNPWIVTAVSTSSVTFTGGAGTPSNGDVLSYTCTGFK